MWDVALDPWHWTLWVFRELKEVRRFERIEAEQHQLQGAWLGAIAFHEPGRLKEEHHNFLDRAGYTATAEDVMKIAATTIVDMMKIDARDESSDALSTSAEGAAE